MAERVARHALLYIQRAVRTRHVKWLPRTIINTTLVTRSTRRQRLHVTSSQKRHLNVRQPYNNTVDSIGGNYFTTTRA